MRAFILAVTGLAFGVIACSSSSDGTTFDIHAPVAAVSVVLPSPSLVEGQTARAVATPRDANGAALANRPIVWQSSSAAIASVTDSGMISAISPGTAVISAASEGVSGEASMIVVPPTPAPVASVSVALAASSISSGQTTQATATTRDADNNVLTGRVIGWSSSNTGVATVSAAGLVRAVAVGTAQISATSESQSGSAALTVAAIAPVPVASVSVTLAASSRNTGQTTQATATTRDANNNVLTGRAITWSSSNTGVATVSSSGLVTAIAVGAVQIMAACEGQSASANFSVTSAAPAPVASVTVALGTGSLNPGLTTQATATTRDANNNVLTGRAITWSSNNTAFATVDPSSGLVTAVAVGTAQITATSEGQSGSATLSVRLVGSSNEPAGMTVISDRPFNALHELGWDEPSNGGSGGSIVQDATAPRSPSSILRMTLPAGFSGGGASYDGDSPAFNVKTLYISHWFRTSSNWQGHPGSSVNKQYYVYTTSNVPSIYFDMYGSGSGTLRPQIAGQSISAGGAGFGDPQNPDWTANLVPSAEIVRGQWYHLEVVLVMNSVGKTDGSVDWWLDGVHIGSHGGIQWQSSSPSWQFVHYADVWGGGGGTVTKTMWLDFDHLYISGK